MNETDSQTSSSSLSESDVSDGSSAGEHPHSTAYLPGDATAASHTVTLVPRKSKQKDTSHSVATSPKQTGTTRTDSKRLMARAKQAYREGDYSTAFKLCKKLEKRDHLQAITFLGIMYRRGEGTDVDPQKALQYLHEAANRGHPGAQFTLAMMYYKAEGMEAPDHVETRRWINAAAKQGNSEAIRFLDTVEPQHNRRKRKASSRRISSSTRQTRRAQLSQSAKPPSPSVSRAARVGTNTTTMVNSQSNVRAYSCEQALALWCCCWCCCSGLHRCYLGQPLLGLACFFTYGFCGFGDCYDLITLQTQVQEANQRAGGGSQVVVVQSTPSVAHMV